MRCCGRKWRRFTSSEGQRERAIDALNRSLALDLDVPQTHQLLGTLWMKDDAARAEKFFREAIRLQPGYAQALANLAILLSETDRTEEAAYTFERAIRLRPNYALAHLNYGMMLRKVGRRDEARQHFGRPPVAQTPLRARLLSGFYLNSAAIKLNMRR